MALTLTTENARNLSFLIKTADDQREFLTHFWDGEARQFFAVNAYRLHKVRQRNMNIIEFERLFAQSSRDALEQLFQQPIDQATANKIADKVKNGRLTSKSIHDRFIEEDGRLNVSRLATS